jgi:RimJ/RimL family protein N-acetyltransferase
VASDNRPALALYRQCGFEIEGTLRHAMVHDGRYFNDYTMTKLLK